MSATAKRSKTRLRKVACETCGYPAYLTRSWMADRGLPVCPCGETMRPTSPADLAYLGLIGRGDMSLAAWNAIARENGWQVIQNHGQAAQSRGKIAPTVRVAPADHCVYPGCGRWVAAGADRCSNGHAQIEDAAPVAAIPF